MATNELLADPIGNMPLHLITSERGTKGLIERFQLEINKLPEEHKQQLVQAFKLAIQWHEGQERTNGPYLDHLLRVVLRVLCYYEVQDVDILVAALLHDAVEDQADRVVGHENATREEAYAVITQTFNQDVADILKALSNPPGDISIDEYNDHVREALIKEPRAIPVKLSDFTDNAVGIEYTKGEEKKFKLAKKYVQVLPFYEQIVNDDIYEFNDLAKGYILRHIQTAKEKLNAVIARADASSGDIGAIALQ